MNYQSGLTLTEVLVSLLIASILMSVLTQCYITNKRQYLEIEKRLEQNFDVQWASELLSDSIRRAGFTPCVSMDLLTSIDRRKEERGIKSIRIDNQLGQSIQINRMNDAFFELQEIQNPSQIFVPNTTSFHNNRPVLIADCEHAEVHDVLNIEKLAKGQLILLNKPLLYSYTTPIYIGEWLEEKWFVKNNKQGQPALFYKLMQTEELAPQIQALHISQKQRQHKQLIQIVMELDKGKTQQLMIAVRGS